MSLENSTSKTLYTGNGVTREFSFPFKVWQASQVRVMLAEPSAKAGEGGTNAGSLSGTETDVTSQVSVSLSPSGGTVTFATAPAPGATLAILRQMPFVQEDRYITGTRFDPHEIEDALDIACAERQELRELALRHLAVPATSAKTPQQVMSELFDIAAKANEYAAQARETYEAAVELKDTVNDYVIQSGDEQVERIDAAGDAEVQDVAATGSDWRDTIILEGNAQLDRLSGYADVGGLEMGLACACQTWTLAADVPAGSTLVLPNELRYVPGRHHLWLSYGGMVLSPTHFTELGATNATSTQFITNVNFKAGQELMAWVIPLGKAYEVELTDRITALEEALADLSRRVVYADAASTASAPDSAASPASVPADATPANDSAAEETA